MTFERIIRPNRREFLQRAFLAANLVALDRGEGAKPFEPREKITDVNVHLGRWPTRRLRGDDSETLSGELRAKGISQAWAGGFDAMLHKDIRGVNDRLAAECSRHGRGLFLPFGSINPKLPGWREELRRCAEYHQMPGIRLHPNYHGYELNDPEFLEVLRAARDRGLIVQLTALMEDERMMHPLLRAKPVNLAPLAGLVRKAERVQLIVLNALGVLRGNALSEIAASGRVYFEISMLEGVGGIENALARIPLERLLFGSHAPFFYLESALLKLKESALTPAQVLAITRHNASKILANAG